MAIDHDGIDGVGSQLLVSGAADVVAKGHFGGCIALLAFELNDGLVLVVIGLITVFRTVEEVPKKKKTQHRPDWLVDFSGHVAFAAWRIRERFEKRI